jgi:hypothetical protein
MHIRSVLVAAMSAATLVVGAAAAHADNIYNNLDTSIDATAEVMPLTAGGAQGTTTLYVDPTNGDGKNGCNLTGSTTLTLDVSSSNAAVATVSPATVTFTSCGDTKALTVTPIAAGSATVSLSQSSNNTGSTFNLAPGTFTVNVSAPTPTNTPPTVAVVGVTGGAAYAKGSVPAATCEVTDAEDGNQSFPASLGPVTGPYAADGIGSQTASCTYTDAGGLDATSSATYGITDPNAPIISYLLDPAGPDGDNGWYRSDVTLDWTVTEAESPSSLSTTGCVDTSVTADQQATDYSCSATSAGGSAGPKTVTIKRDGTAPSVSTGDPSGTLGSNGWYISPFTVPFTATDTTSGVAGPATVPVTSSGEGAAVTVQSPEFTDNAGNAMPTGAMSKSFGVDLTDPTASFDSEIGSVYFGSVPAAPTCTASDDVSGPAGCQVSGYSTAVGTHTLTATATDNAGRTGTETMQYTVLAWTLSGFYQPVDMGGVLNTVKNGSTVPLKFEVFAGAAELSNTSVVESFSVKGITCPGTNVLTDDIELTTTGGTSLRYDTTGGQFVQNWQTPKKAGVCYSVTMKTIDGSSITASFKLK